MIGIAGLSHLGLVTGVAMASKGFDVVGYDPDESLTGNLGQNRLPVFEPKLAELLERSQGRIRFTSSPDALRSCDVVYLAKDVATSENNQSDLAPLRALIDRIVPFLNAGTTFVLHSQVPPGFTRKLRDRLQPSGVLVYYQVETLIFGRAVERALHPERTIVGCAEPARSLPPSYSKLLAAYGCPLMPMRYESAELCKISINLFLISSVTTTNMLAELSERIGADWSEIAPALRLDRRIGPHAYLTPGLGLSGGNLERDLATLGKLGTESGSDVNPAASFQRDSEYRRDWVLRRLHAEVFSRDSQGTVALWGLAYKPDTHSIKNSPAILLVEQLKGIGIRAYDPQVRLGPDYDWVTQVASPLEACRGASALVVMTPWEEFKAIPLQSICEQLKTRVILDPFGLFAPRIQEAGLRVRYLRLGVPPEGPTC